MHRLACASARTPGVCARAPLFSSSAAAPAQPCWPTTQRVPLAGTRSAWTQEGELGSAGVLSMADAVSGGGRSVHRQARASARTAGMCASQILSRAAAPARPCWPTTQRTPLAGTRSAWTRQAEREEESRDRVGWQKCGAHWAGCRPSRRPPSSWGAGRARSAAQRAGRGRGRARARRRAETAWGGRGAGPTGQVVGHLGARLVVGAAAGHAAQRSAAQRSALDAGGAAQSRGG